MVYAFGLISLLQCISMLRKIIKLPYWLYIVVAMALVTGVAYVSFVVYVRSTALNEKKIRRQYSAQFSSLEAAVNGIPATLDLSIANTPENLDHYYGQLDKVFEPCGNITGHVAQFSAVKGVSQQTKDQLTQSEHLCSDLTNVTKYSQTLYKSSEALLFLNTSPWPDARDKAFTERLDSTKQAMAASKLSIQNVSFPTVSDPAQPELLTIIDRVSKQALQINDALGKSDYGKAGTDAAILSKEIEKAKIDFLSARSYFWNNTVEFTALQKAIARLKDGFAAK